MRSARGQRSVGASSQLPSATQHSPSVAAVTATRTVAESILRQPGPCLNASSSTSGTSRIGASFPAKWDLPTPEVPTTTTLRGTGTELPARCQRASREDAINSIILLSRAPFHARQEDQEIPWPNPPEGRSQPITTPDSPKGTDNPRKSGRTAVCGWMLFSDRRWPLSDRSTTLTAVTSSYRRAAVSYPNWLTVLGDSGSLRLDEPGHPRGLDDDRIALRMDAAVRATTRAIYLAGDPSRSNLCRDDGAPTAYRLSSRQLHQN